MKKILVIVCVAALGFTVGRLTFPVEQKTEISYFSISQEEQNCRESNGVFNIFPLYDVLNLQVDGTITHSYGVRCFLPSKVISEFYSGPDYQDLIK